jgi:cation diffusion facilitator CzcD-associated flavoprotein CzcO
MPRLPNISSIAVIGSGPCGAGLTKALLAEKKFTKINVFERRSKFGGLWNYTPLKGVTVPSTLVPNTDPFQPTTKCKVEDQEFYESPVYKLLDANVPKDLMAYNNSPFPKDVPLFPTHDQILKYIENYSQEIKDSVQFDTEVVHVEPKEDKWSVTSKDLNTGEQITDTYDAVCIATGSYDHPFIPDVEGLSEWHKKHPGSVLHAKTYDHPLQFKDKRNILVVGNSASGGDIAYQLATNLKKVIYKSIRSENHMPAAQSDLIKDVPDLARFDGETRTIYFKDGSSLTDVDTVLFCTGYLKSIPFLKDPPIITDGRKVHNMYNHLIYSHNPTLAVIGLPRFVLPTRLSESQGCWLARVWAGEISLPSIQEMENYCDSLEGAERAHHDLMYPKDVEYSNMLNSQAREATGDRGYQAVEWDEEQCKIRANIKTLKESYVKYLADSGKRAQSIEELITAGYFAFPEETK